MALQGIYKSFTAEITKEYAKFAKLYFEALCLIENAEINDSFLNTCVSVAKIQLYKRDKGRGTRDEQIVP
jgi:hypothetical protein